MIRALRASLVHRTDSMPPTQPGRTFVYRIDPDDRVVFVTREWESFAQENRASQLTAAAVCGQPWSRFVIGKETQHLYQVIIDSVRRDRRTIAIPFRCDGPNVRRYMELTVSPWGVEGFVQFEGRIVREEAREIVSLLEPSAGRNDGYVVMCSWCKRVDASGDWLEVEDAVRRLALFKTVDLPQITHGVCVDCAARIQLDLDGVD